MTDLLILAACGLGLWLLLSLPVAILVGRAMAGNVDDQLLDDE